MEEIILDQGIKEELQQKPPRFATILDYCILENKGKRGGVGLKFGAAPPADEPFRLVAA